MVREFLSFFPGTKGLNMVTVTAVARHIGFADLAAFDTNNSTTATPSLSITKRRQPS
jgi:hypothetical protein